MSSLRWILLVLSLFHFSSNVNPAEIYRTAKIHACGEKLYHIIRYTCSSQYRRKRSLSISREVDNMDPQSVDSLSQSHSLEASEMEDIIATFGEDLSSEDMRLLSFLVKEKAIFFDYSEPISEQGYKNSTVRHFSNTQNRSQNSTENTQNISQNSTRSISTQHISQNSTVNTQHISQNSTISTQHISQNSIVNTQNIAQNSTISTQHISQNCTSSTLNKNQNSISNQQNRSQLSTARLDTGRVIRRHRRHVTDECCISTCWILTLRSYCGRNRLG